MSGKDRSDGSAGGETPQGGFLISKIHQAAGRVFNRMLKRHGIREINSAQGRILFVLWREDGIPIGELSRRTGLERSTLTSMLDRLEDGGQLVRIPDPADRRVTIIRLTEKNRSVHASYRNVSDEMNGLFYRGFTNEEIRMFESYLERTLDNLAEAEETDGEPT